MSTWSRYELRTSPARNSLRGISWEKSGRVPVHGLAFRCHAIDTYPEQSVR
ncbi:hypothetical protein FHS29_000412 [Saccharothrix tamanrassetensis]|uniref:Uncharacterized protein n=1 Tax=Saccharothrix tamanrassetensis TaxID=1051531 RepID=A0A841C5N3_9PSEU|nr:hypothetical protein [Saccharothrix tamanrassetensis]MBB5953842.1 hypothetical protein [Saccharothrix tamanrassetensis]